MVQKIINYDFNSPIPKYRQIINSVQIAIEDKVLVKGSKIPSINQICGEFNFSRDTVLLAFNELKTKGVIFSQPGKGYYVSSTSVKQDERIFVVFDELNSFKEDMYNSFLSNLNGKAIEIYFFIILIIVFLKI